MSTQKTVGKPAKKVPAVSAAKKANCFDIAQMFTDPLKEVQGTWVKMEGTDTEWLVARANNPAFSRAFQQSLLDAREHRKELEAAGTPPTPEEIDILTRDTHAELVGRHILKGWKNLVLHGEELEFSEDLAVNMLKRSSDMMDLIWNISHNVEHFRSEVSLDILKN